MGVLDQIHRPDDVRALERSRLGELCADLRDRIIDLVSRQGGHLGASLGTIELTVALHYTLNTPHDMLVWDVGHQAYGHKILTERKDQFASLRQQGGISGFPKRAESEYDVFGTGHSSTSISAILGMAVANRIQGIDRQHVAVIGDAAMQAGMAFEALNHAGVSGTDILVVLNDNRMSIDPSVGALNDFLEQAASRYNEDPKQVWQQLAGSATTPTNVFEDLHLRYFGPIDGHNLDELIPALEKLRSVSGPKLLHVLTQKGKGYAPAERGNATQWHAPGLFDKATGKVLVKDKQGIPPKFQDVFGRTLVELAEMNERVVGITPAMPTGSSLTFLMEAFPDRAFDVGIAEQHAVTFSAGLATQGVLPYCVIYSTFMQRSYDQVIHDVAIQNLKVIFCLDRAGLVGADGATHHGVYDLAYMRCIPNLVICAPRNEYELRQALYTAQTDAVQGPMVIRYPRGRGFLVEWPKGWEELPIGKGVSLRSGADGAILAIGIAAQFAYEAAENLKQEGWNIAVYDLRFVKPLDTALIEQVIASGTEHLWTVEDGCINGGFGSAVAEVIAQSDFKGSFESAGVPDEVIEHATPQQLYAYCGIDPQGIAEMCRKQLKLGSSRGS